MAGCIVSQNGPFDKEQARNWENFFFQEGCAYAQKQAQEYLQQLDDYLYARRPEGWRVEGKRERTVVTRFGEVTIRRRMYRDEKGKARFLLDEYLGLPSQEVAVPTVREQVLQLTAEVGFERAAGLLEGLTAGVLSPMTLWRIVQRTGRGILREEEEARRVYQGGSARAGICIWRLMGCGYVCNARRRGIWD